LSQDKTGSDEDVIIVDSNISNEVLTLSRDLVNSEGAVIIDTNYLTLVGPHACKTMINAKYNLSESMI
jgi:hypothetical protein